MHIKKIKNWCS